MLNATIQRHPPVQLVRGWKPMAEGGWIWICPFLAHFLKHLLSLAARDSFLGDLVWPLWMFCRFVSKWSVVKWHLDFAQNKSDAERHGNSRGSLQSSCRDHGLFVCSEPWQHVPELRLINLMDLVTKCHKNLNLPAFVCLFALWPKFWLQELNKCGGCYSWVKP